jgi:hypothetical protein
MITLCKGCGAAQDEAVETCRQCGTSNPWFSRQRSDSDGPREYLWVLLIEPLLAIRWRRRPLTCPACDAEVVRTSVRCSKCGASLQSLVLQERSGPTLEGIGVWLFLVATLFLYGWSRIEPWVYRVAPEFRASKQGPPELPVVINIRLTGLRVANDVTERRSCVMEIGTAKIFHAARFALAPGEVRELPYASFTDGSAGLTEAAGYHRARQGISIDCTDTRGVSRRIWF